MKIDYKYKSEILKSDLCQTVNEINKSIYADYVLRTTGETIKCKYDIDTANKLRCLFLTQDEKAYKEAEKIVSAKYRRVVRLSQHIKKMLAVSDNVTFVTFTFRDDVLQSTSEETRRRYITRYLSEFFTDYVANIDYGGKNGREHYHAVVNDVITPHSWKYGILNFEAVQTAKEFNRVVPARYRELAPDEQKECMKRDTEKRLAKYTSKLTNHAIKETTKRNSAIFPRLKRQSSEYVPTDYQMFHHKNGRIEILQPTNEVDDLF